MKIGFIGAGNITKAMLLGMLEKDASLAGDIMISNRSAGKLEALKNQYPSLTTTMDNNVVASACDVIFLSVKPNMYAEVISGIRDQVKEAAIIICPAAGLTLSYIEECFGKPMKIVRGIPNTPSMVGEGMTAVCANAQVTPSDMERVQEILNRFGKCEIIPEELFHVFIGACGSSPAYVYMFIDAMAKAAAHDGMPYAQALTFAAQSTLGAAKMVLATGTDPETLTANVCSPGGTTIEAVQVFREKGLEELVYEAQHACVEKSKKLAK